MKVGFELVLEVPEPEMIFQPIELVELKAVLTLK